MEYITPGEVARGVELSGKGFEERQAARAVPMVAGNGHDREPELVQETRLALPDVAVHPTPVSVTVEGPQVHLPAPVVAVEGTRVEVLQQAAPDVRLDFDVDRWADRLEAALAKRPILVNVSPNIVVNVPAQEAARVEVTVAPTPVSISVPEPKGAEVVLKPEVTVAIPEPRLRRVVKAVTITRDPATREMTGADVVEEEYAK